MPTLQCSGKITQWGGDRTRAQSLSIQYGAFKTQVQSLVAAIFFLDWDRVYAYSAVQWKNHSIGRGSNPSPDLEHSVWRLQDPGSILGSGNFLFLIFGNGNRTQCSYKGMKSLSPIRTFIHFLLVWACLFKGRKHNSFCLLNHVPVTWANMLV